MFRVVSCVVGSVFLLWSVRSLGETLLAFALLHSLLEGQKCLLLQVFLHSSLLWWKGHFFWGVLEGLRKTVQLQLLQLYWPGHRLRFLWYWMVCLCNEQRSFCRFWDCIQELYFGLLLTMIATPFFRSTYNLYLLTAFI